MLVVVLGADEPTVAAAGSRRCNRDRRVRTGSRWSIVGAVAEERDIDVYFNLAGFCWSSGRVSSTT